MKAKNQKTSFGLAWESANPMIHKPTFLITPGYFDVRTKEVTLLSLKNVPISARFEKISPLFLK